MPDDRQTLPEHSASDERRPCGFFHGDPLPDEPEQSSTIYVERGLTYGTAQRGRVAYVPQTTLDEALDALERLHLNALSIFAERSVRDWDETLAESEGVLRRSNRSYRR